MSGRSPSGVASLRARFEQNANSESPSPSRGRSPAGSFTSDTSRPLSKVRTSFISVGEPSGQMSHLTAETDVGAPIPGDGAQLSSGQEQSKLNGSGPTSAPRETGVELAERKKGQPDPESGEKPSEKQEASTKATDPAFAGLSKPTTDGKKGVPSTQPSDSKGESGPTDSGPSKKDAPNLGSILKGSAFEKEEEEAKKAFASQEPAQPGAAKAKGKATSAPKATAPPATTKPTEKKTEKPAEKLIEEEKASNGKPKETKALEPKSQPKPQTKEQAPTRTQTAPKSEPAAVAKPAVKEVERKEAPAKDVPTETAPPATAKEAAPPVAAPPAATKTDDKTAKSTAGPSATTSSKVSPPAKKETSAETQQPEARKEAAKEANKEAPKETPREGPKATTATASKPAATKTDHKNDGTSKPNTAKPAASSTSTASKAPQKNPSSQKPPLTSGVGFTKPKPRSPTRPVKLPSHLLAQTAASAAKHGDESHTEPHKDTATASSKPSSSKNPVHALPQQRKQPRMSMPATSSSKPAEKEKAKPRMSVAGAGAASGSFLERMMRPTQSSAQKTHDKVDPGKLSPPRRPSGSRTVSGAGPKTATGASTHQPDEHAHNDGGHGHGREKHGGPTKSEVEHGEGQEALKAKSSAAQESTTQGEGQNPSAAGIAGDTPKDA